MARSLFVLPNETLLAILEASKARDVLACSVVRRTGAEWKCREWQRYEDVLETVLLSRLDLPVCSGVLVGLAYVARNRGASQIYRSPRHLRLSFGVFASRVPASRCLGSTVKP
ncbi:hypothetical protein BV25DRAFT_1826668 [Artomyces pyxidatus]|uniref:Uncharacterized protein n=1 Tax=Artomyces pyxidatus TaxID=48021 RepID=A0ACB8SYI8_9AGAM|nr:hypothetical protein BV25DRAFT_1826668 [Artomyces pyxidatus]